MPFIYRHGLLLLLALHAIPSFGCECTFTRVQVDPVEPSRMDLFIGKGNSIELQFRNEKTDPNVTVFPEPPLIVRHQLSDQRCEIDGGVWVRQAVYLSNNEETLLVQEFSGSNDQLVFYRTKTCEKFHEIDVSGSRWTVSGNKLSIGRRCSGEDIKTCKSQKRLQLEKYCSATKKNGK